jgi:hypothetical protein
MKIGLLANINLHVASSENLEAFLDHLSTETKKLDVLCIAGNIAAHDSVEYYLRVIHGVSACHIYFILGANDFAFYTLNHMRQSIIKVCAKYPKLHYVSNSGAIFNNGEKLMILGCEIFPHNIPAGNYTHNNIDDLSLAMLRDNPPVYAKNAYYNTVVSVKEYFDNYYTSDCKVVSLSSYPPCSKIALDENKALFSKELDDVLREVSKGRTEVLSLCAGREDAYINKVIQVKTNVGRTVRILDV